MRSIVVRESFEVSIVNNVVIFNDKIDHNMLVIE